MAYFHDFRLRDAQGRCLLGHGGICLLELNKFHAEAIQSEQERWLKFFKDGATLDSEALPSWMGTPEMRRAMSTLKTFSEKERAYHAYQARQNYLREQRSIQRYIEELRAEAEQAQAAMAQAQADTDEALAAMAKAEVPTEQAKAGGVQAKVAEAQAQATAERATAVAEQERVAKEAAFAEIERLKAQLLGQKD